MEPHNNSPPTPLSAGFQASQSPLSLQSGVLSPEGSVTDPFSPSSSSSSIAMSPGSNSHNSFSCTAGSKWAKLCGVCGDKALGCNFNAITCESCKAFFRRNALKNKEFRCPFNNDCKIDAVTRRFCQRCRLKKCFDIGMKKEWILTEAEKTVKRRKIEENRTKRKGDTSFESQDHAEDNCDGNTTDEDLTRHSKPELTNRPQARVIGIQQTAQFDKMSKTITTAAKEIKTEPEDPPLSNSLSGACEDNDARKTETEDNSPVGFSTVDSILSVAIRAEYHSSTTLRSPVVDPTLLHRDKSLNEAEKGKLQELVIANKAMTAPLTDDGAMIHTDDPSLLNVINLTDIAIRRIIRVSKKVYAFKTLCQEDQIALLKGGCTEVMILRSVMSYDADKGWWMIPQGGSDFSHIKVDVLKEARGNLYEEHQRFILSFCPTWRADQYIMLLLGAITLFEPERPNVIHKDVIRLEQDSYYYLLRRYLESELGGCEARSTFLKLIQKVEELHVLNEKLVRVYLDVNPREVEPLLIEIFDLKTR